MIIVKIVGGLGNQMFQYAYGRCLAEKSGQELKLDLFDLENPHLVSRRQFGLQVFRLPVNAATVAEVARFRRPPRSKSEQYWQIAARSLFGIGKKNYQTEPGTGFSPALLDGRGERYLDGYWQSEKYFLDIEPIIRGEFKLKDEFSVESRPIASDIRNCIAVSLHVRRGDYVTDAATNEFHGTCSLEYYAAAVRLIASRVSSPRFFVFSDDIGWVKENLKIDYPVVYVSDGNYRDYEELTLMSFCKHNIIANSSFSWWGAWLNANPNKIVVAPKRWFKDESADTRDLIPDSWIRI